MQAICACGQRRSAWGSCAARFVQEQQAGSAAISPREHLLFDIGWNFKFGYGGDPAKTLVLDSVRKILPRPAISFKVAARGFDDSNWRSLNLPHDWAVELPFVHDDEEDMFHGADPDYKLMASQLARNNRSSYLTFAIMSRFGHAVHHCPNGVRSGILDEPPLDTRGKLALPSIQGFTVGLLQQDRPCPLVLLIDKRSFHNTVALAEPYARYKSLGHN